MSQPDVATGPGRRLSYWAFVLVVIGYLVVIKGIGYLVGAISDVDDISTTRGVVMLMWIPLGAALVYTYLVAAVLGWLRPVLHDDRPVQRWVWVVPVVFAICIAVAIDYAGLSEKGLGYVIALLLATQFVGWGEEGMFRGIGVTALRDHGLSEGRVALWSSVVFGVVHLSNAIGGEAAKALPQALIVSFAGYFFYLTRRVSGGNVVNSVVHGMFDFSIISGTTILLDQKPYVGVSAAILAYLVVGCLLVIRRKHIELGPTGQ